MFGLQWETLVGQNLEKQSLKQAKSYKATHFVRAGRHSSAFGYAKLQSSDRKVKGTKYYSAAAIFAQGHPQGVYWQRRDMPDDTVWVVAVQDGVVVSGTDIICTHSDAEGLHQALIERYEHIVQVDHDEHSDDSLNYLNERTALIEAKTGIENIPVPVLIGVGALAFLVLADMGWDSYKSYKQKQERARQALSYIDPAEVWAEELDKWQSSTLVSGKESLLAAYNTLSTVPLNVGSWTLQSAGCDHAPAGWSCSAIYKRLTGTNQTFKNAAPPSWELDWHGLDVATGSWTAPNAHHFPVDRKLLPAGDDIRLNYISRLQSVMTSFERLTLDPAVEVNIPAPAVVDSNGNTQMVAHPGNLNPNIALPKKQSFMVQAPMRSMLVFPVGSNFKFDGLHFEYRAGGASSLSRSMIMATLKGKYYVQ